MNYKRLSKIHLGFFPTPIHKLKNLARELSGPNILIKRDDQTGLAFGGNKTRKLEFLLADAIAKGCDTIVTGGSEQSNHCRQTAAATATRGLKCHLVLGGECPQEIDGNLFLDKLLGAKIHWSGEFRKGEKMPEIVTELEEQGKKPYLIPYGGSNSIGAASFVEAVNEVMEQTKELDEKITHIVFASSSGGTHAGLALGKEIFQAPFEILGIAIDKHIPGETDFHKHVTDLTNQTARQLEYNKVFTLSDIHLINDYIGKGYGILDAKETRAIKLLAQSEGILLDPVYTSKAMAGLIAMIETGKFSSQDTILFWHTGGSPALFKYKNNGLC